jgi:glycosyltransferase involved in cell wall biosynthesis
MKNNNFRVCYVFYGNEPETNFENLSIYTFTHGFDVFFITFLSKKENFITENNKERKFFKIDLKNNRKKRLRLLEFIFKAIKIINRENFDIVHIHSSCKYFSLIKMLSKANSKFIYHITSYPIQKSHLRSLEKMIFIYIQTFFVDKIIVQSQELKNKLVGIRKNKKAIVVPVGFNKNIFHGLTDEEKKRIRKSIGIKANEIILVYCGKISKIRNLTNMVESFYLVQKEKKNIRFLMIGDGDAIDEIKEFALNKKIFGKLIITGEIPYRSVKNYLAIADIGISYIPINENFNYNPPLKTFEYLACELPTIATKTVSNQIIIRNNINGILVDDNPTIIAKSILNLLNDKERQKLLKINSRRSILEYDFENVTRNTLIPIYKNLIT